MATNQAISFEYEYTDPHGVAHKSGGVYANASEYTSADQVRSFVKKHVKALREVPEESIHVTLLDGGLSAEAQRRLSQAFNTNLSVRSSR